MNRKGLKMLFRMINFFLSVHFHFPRGVRAFEHFLQGMFLLFEKKQYQGRLGCWLILYVPEHPSALSHYLFQGIHCTGRICAPFSLFTANLRLFLQRALLSDSNTVSCYKEISVNKFISLILYKRPRSYFRLVWCLKTIFEKHTFTQDSVPQLVLPQDPPSSSNDKPPSKLRWYFQLIWH